MNGVFYVRVYVMNESVLWEIVGSLRNEDGNGNENVI